MFDELKEKMWTKNKRTKDLIQLLNAPALINRVSKFLLATNELIQFKHLKKASETDAESIDYEKKAPMKDVW